MINPFKGTRYEDASLSKLDDLTEEQAKKISDWLENPRHILYVYSTVGLGKTYLSAAITNRRFEQKKYCWYWNEMTIFKMLEVEKQEGRIPEYTLEQWSENNFIIWDDMGSMLSHNKNDYTDAEKKQWMFAFVDYRYTSQLPTVITSNYSPEHFSQFMHPRFCSRINAKENLIIELNGSDKRQEGL